MKLFEKRRPYIIMVTGREKEEVMTFVNGICARGKTPDVEDFDGLYTVTFKPKFSKETVNLGLMATFANTHVIKFGRRITWIVKRD